MLRLKFRKKKKNYLYLNKFEINQQMEDQWVNGCLTIYIERDVTCRIDNKDIMQRFQNNNPHRKQL